VLDGLCLVFVHFGQNSCEVRGNFLPHFTDQIHTLVGDANHDLAAIFRGVDALDVPKLFQTIDEAVAAAVECPIFFAISDMVRYSSLER
jgi:hypothetical protein